MAKFFVAIACAFVASVNSQVSVPTLLQAGNSPSGAGRFRQSAVVVPSENRRPAEFRVRPVRGPSGNAAIAANLLEEATNNNYPIDPYNFGYDVKDEFGNHQYRKEEADERGVVRGTYGYTDAAGLYRFVDYVADASGFKATIRSNEPGVGNAHAADITLTAEEPPRSVLELASAPRPSQAAPSRFGRQREAASNQAYSELKPVSAGSERIRYALPLPSVSAPASTASSPEDSSSPLPRSSRFGGNNL